MSAAGLQALASLGWHVEGQTAIFWADDTEAEITRVPGGFRCRRFTRGREGAMELTKETNAASVADAQRAALAQPGE